MIQSTSTSNVLPQFHCSDDQTVLEFFFFPSRQPVDGTVSQSLLSGQQCGDRWGGDLKSDSIKLSHEAGGAVGECRATAGIRVRSTPKGWPLM